MAHDIHADGLMALDLPRTIFGGHWFWTFRETEQGKSPRDSLKEIGGHGAVGVEDMGK